MSNPQAEEHKKKGNDLSTAGKFAEAAAEFTKAIEIDPKNHVYWSNRSAALASQDKYEEALNDAKKCIDLKPDWAKGYSRAGLAYYKLDRWEDARQAYEDGLAKCPNDAALQKALADLDEAEASSMPPGANPFGNLFGPDMWTKLAMNPQTRDLVSKPEVAAKLKLLQSNPQALGQSINDPDVMKCLGVLLGLPADFSEAKQPPNARPAASGEAHDHAAHAGDAHAHHDHGAHDGHSHHTPSPKSHAAPPGGSTPKAAEPPKPKEKPESEMTEEEKTKKRAVEQKDLGNDLFKTRKFEDALAAYSKAIELDPTEATFYSNRAAVYIHQNKFEQAVEDCQKAVEVGQAHRADYGIMAKAYARMAQAYQKMDRLKDAEEAYDRSLLQESNEKIRNQLREVREERKKKDAEAYVNPELSEQHKKRGDEAFKEGNWAKAIEEYTEAYKRDPKNYRVLSNRALCYTKLMDWQRGLEDCEKILAIEPSFAKAYLRKGKIQHFLKQYHKALDTYNKGLSYEPDNADLKAALNDTQMAIARDMSGEADPNRAQEAMKDPEIQQILRDPTINKILQDMSSDPKTAMAALRDPDISAKINKLIAAGVLRMGK